MRRPALLALVAVAVAIASQAEAAASTCRIAVDGAQPLCRTFAAFRRVQTDADRLPRWLARSRAVRTNHLSRRSARRLRARSPALWVLAGDDRVCLVRAVRRARFVTVICRSHELAIAEGIVLRGMCAPAQPDNSYEVVALVQDGAAEVRILFDDGTTRPVAPRRNHFRALALREPGQPAPDRVAWRAPAGNALHSFTVEEDEDTVLCA